MKQSFIDKLASLVPSRMCHVKDTWPCPIGWQMWLWVNCWLTNAQNTSALIPTCMLWVLWQLHLGSGHTTLKTEHKTPNFLVKCLQIILQSVSHKYQRNSKNNILKWNTMLDKGNRNWANESHTWK